MRDFFELGSGQQDRGRVLDRLDRGVYFILMIHTTSFCCIFSLQLFYLLKHQMDLLTQRILFYGCLLDKLSQNRVSLDQFADLKLEVDIGIVRIDKLKFWKFELKIVRSAALYLLLFYL